MLLFYLINFHKIKNKKIFLLAFIPFLIIGCDSVGGVNLTDTRGNKYTFKNESVTCTADSVWGDIDCVGSAIKKDIGGSRFTTQFPETECMSYFMFSKSAFGPARRYYTKLKKDVLCQAANQLGKISPLKTKEVFNVPSKYK